MATNNNKSNERILLICESPNKIKTLKSFLPSNYVVMASVGHIIEISDGGNYHNTGIDIDNNFKPSFKVSKDKQEVVKKLKEQVKLADKVILASDPDREGEAIAWSLKEFLKVPSNKCFRITFHEITKKAVLEALENPRKIDDDLVHASHARQKLDKLLGYRMSDIARKNVGARSVGRCQSAGLELIADREDSILSFVPQKYGELLATLIKNGQEFKAKYTPKKPKDAKPSYDECLEASKIIDKSLKEGNLFTISDIERKSVKSSPKPPFITSTFQQEVSSKLGISVEQATSYAQKLFEGINIDGKHVGLITYIRTDDTSMSPDFIETLKDFVKEKYGEEYYAPIKKAKNNENAQAGHECLRVVDLTMTPELLKEHVSDERLLKVYDIIYRRTIACTMSPSITSETIYTLTQSGYTFTMTSKELLFDGYQKVYNYRDKDDDDPIIKEVFENNEKVKCSSLNVEEKSTNPPARYKEATFIKELEKTGIGRPSTYATIVKTLLKEDRGYCTIDNKCIVPTEKGMALAKFLKDNFPNLINVEYTSNMEKGLDLIAQGKMDEIEFLQNFINTMEESIKNTNLSSSTQIPCPICGAPMKIRKGPYGTFYGCTKYPECKGIIKLNNQPKEKN